MSFFKKHKKQLIKYGSAYSISILVYFLSFLVFSLILALICKNTDIPEMTASVLLFIFVGISAVLCGFTSGIILKEKGLITGIILNIILIIIKLLVCLFIFDRSQFLDKFYIVMLLDFLGIISGCIFAVNKKPKKYY